MTEDPRSRPFRDSVADVAAADSTPATPRTLAPAYRLAFADQEFITREELRPVRLQLELLKPEMLMDECGVRSTVVIMGGARVPSPERPGSAVHLEHWHGEALADPGAISERDLRFVTVVETARDAVDAIDGRTPSLG
jgi:hypothetical protein